MADKKTDAVKRKAGPAGKDATPAKKSNKNKPRNYNLGNGVYRFSRSRMHHKKALYKFVGKKTPKPYEVAQLYSVAEASKNETGGGDGIEVLRNEPFENHPLLGGKYSKGIYTYKIYHLASKVPNFVRVLAPKGSLEVHEEAWNAYPYCKTVLTNPGYMKDGFKVMIETFHVADRGGQDNNPGYMKENFYIVIETLHLPDTGNENNVHQLPEERLKIREVVHIDIAHDPVTSTDYKADEDPQKFRSKKTGRGPLTSRNWKNEVKPVMTCYKLVTAEFKWFGMQGTMENLIQNTERQLFTNFHRQLFCWMDRWFGLTMEDIKKIEDQTKRDLDQQRNQGEVRGMRG